MRPGKTTLVHFTSTAVTSVAGFVATFAIATLFGPAGLGSYAIATALGYYWLGIPATAVSDAIRKRVSEGTGGTAFFTTGIALNWAIGLGLAATVYAVGAILPSVIDPATNELAYVLSAFNGPVAVLVLATYTYRPISGGLQGQKRVGIAGVLEAAERVVRTLVQVAVLLAGYGVSALVLGHAATLVLAAAGGFLLLGVSATRPTRRHLESIAGFARYAWMSALRSRTFSWMDTIVLSLFVGAALIGIYEAAWGIASLLAVVSASIQHTLFPEISDLGTDAAYDRVKHFLDEGLVFAGVFVIPGLFGAVAIGERVLAFYSPEFSRGAGVLVLLVFAYWFDVYASQFVSAINAIDHPDVAYRVNGLFIVVNLALNVVLVWTLGWYGAAIATGLSSMVRLVLGYRGLSSLIGRPKVPFREIGLEVLAAAGMAVVVLGMRPMALEGRIGTLQLVGLGALVYGAILVSISGRIRQKVLSLLPVAIR